MKNNIPGVSTVSMINSLKKYQNRLNKTKMRARVYLHVLDEHGGQVSGVRGTTRTELLNIGTNVPTQWVHSTALSECLQTAVKKLDLPGMIQG